MVIRQMRVSVLVVCSLVLIAMASGCGEPATTPTTGPALTLDQSQTSLPRHTGLEGDTWLSQSFVPSMSTLTAAELNIGTLHADVSCPLIVEVRGDSNGLPSGTVLTSISVTIDIKKWGWRAFDIPNLSVNPGTRYHLVLYSTTNYFVGMDSGNPYPDGHMGNSTDAGTTWKSFFNDTKYDLAFKIYGTP